jgi:toxin FitB
LELLDTNVVSELVRAKPNRQVLSWSSQNKRFYLSVVSVEEIWFGLKMQPSVRIASALSLLFDTFAEVLPITEAIAKTAAELRAEQARRGHIRTQADMLIAATAYEHSAVLLTRNTKDFEGCGLRVRNPFVG